MDYKIVQKDSFTVLGVSKTFSYENAKAEIPKFWNEFFAAGNGKYVCGMYGVRPARTMKSRRDTALSCTAIPRSIRAACRMKTIPARCGSR